MSVRIGFVGCLLALVGALWAQSAPSRVVIDRSRSLGAAATYRNLTLFPVFDSAAHSSEDLLTLDDGLRAKAITVHESKNGGDVNTLYVSNVGKKPVYLMAGEVVLGGQQDRCLGRDVIVPPGKKDMPVTVFCVEHGRWSGRHEFDQTAVMVASAEIRASAQDGAFAAGRPAASPPMAGGQAAGPVAQARRALPGFAATVGEKQQQVWDRVAAKNAKFKASPATGTYRDVLNQSGGEAKASIGPYVKALSGALPADPHLVGVVAAVNGQVLAADIFGNPALFRKLWPKLLRSYSADAAELSSRTTKRQALTAADAKAFLASAADSKSKMENRSDVSTTLRLETPTSLTYRIESPKASAGGGGLGGSAIHTNVLKK